MDCVEFKVNGKKCSVGGDVNSTTTLVEYLRTKLELRGTKYMCLEGGCGAAVGRARSASLSALCLVSVTSCQDWQITTIEKVGNRLKGYHPLQKILAETNGTQCGYCSPGWVMSMYSLIKSRPTMLEIERSLSGNICRCTGYRPILEAFKKFASDAPERDNLPDIEELRLCKQPNDESSNHECDERDWCLISRDTLEESVTFIQLNDDRQWFGVKTIADIFYVLLVKGVDSYMFVAGNTGKGVIPITEYPRTLIDISRVLELKTYFIDQNLVIGGGTTLSEFMEILKETSDTEYFEYLKKINDHLQFVAHVAVRNLGTIAGNLMLKHQNPSFSSDMFLLLEAIGAQLTLVLAPGVTKTVSLCNFLAENMKGKIILNVLIPPLTRENRLVTYKIAARSRNAHAIVNAAFLFRYNEVDNIVQSCRIVYGGLSPRFNRARNTENYLIGKKLFTNDTLQKALRILSSELVLTENPPEPSVLYRKQAALGLFYKALLSLCPNDIVHARYKSGASKLHEARPVSKGSQSFETNPNLWPLNQPMPKLDALIQCAGESKYAEDLPSLPKEVFAAFVVSTVPLGTIESIDATEALKQKGVITFYTAKDITGVNSFTSSVMSLNSSNEEILCSGNILYYNQPIGIIVADSNFTANRAALMVDVRYSKVSKPKIDIKVNKNDPNKSTLYRTLKATDRGSNVTKVIKGDQTIFGQCHFCLEVMNCVTRPSEDGLNVRPSTHDMDSDHFITAQSLNMSESRVDVEVRRVGGSFGVKLSRQALITAACSLVSYKLNRPCRLIMPLRIQTRMIGKRMPCSTNFEIGVSANGVIQYVNYDLYSDNGCIVNELIIEIAIDNYYNCYNKDRWNFRCFNVVTDTASNTWFRSPGALEAITTAEMIMERIAYELGLDPLAVRMSNLGTENQKDIKEMLDALTKNSDYNERKNAVDKFNTKNRWKKRGLRFTFMKWTGVVPFILNIQLSVYHGDGSVAITHGGVEIGQGIHTKAVQVCAYFLKIPMEKIHIKSSNTMINPNNFRTAGSLTSQNVALGVQRCCKKLLTRLNPIRTKMNNPTWEQLVAESFRLGVNLQANAYVGNNEVVNYDVYGMTLAEVEIDVLTGQSEILRIDIMQDVGRSVSPMIDIGQVEGAFVMGTGYWTSEELVYSQSTGELLTDRSWNYYVPGATDIPQDFRVYFRKKSYSNDMILGSKAMGEPPICMGVVVPIAMRQAIASARFETGIPSKKWFQIDGPYTVEKICLACETKIEDFKFY